MTDELPGVGLEDASPEDIDGTADDPVFDDEPADVPDDAEPAP